MFHRTLVSVLFGSLLVVTGVGCTKPTDDGGGGGSKDGGQVGDNDGGADAGDGKCHSQMDCPGNQYCELNSGECIDAKPCHANPGVGDPTGAGSCEYQEDDENTDYCWNGGCYCDLTRNGGTCLPRVKKCEACTADIECGNDPTFNLPPAKCVDFTPTAGGASSKVCLPAPSNNATCPSGYVRTNDTKYAGLCVPAGGACGAAGPCSSDDDCDAEGPKPVCQVSPGGYCIAACTFDWRTGESSCPNGKVCHVDLRLTQPASNRNFGGGRCDPPCDDGSYTCPEGTECTVDGLSGNKRCRPPPPLCIRDEDCAPNAATHNTGYCNRSTMKCEEGCTKDSHCSTGYSCVGGQCNEKTCIEQGGANIACVSGQFCCGEAGGPTCPTGVSKGACYDAENPPWCEGCSADGFAGQPDDVNRPTESFCAGQKLWHACEMTGPLSQCPQLYRCSEGPSFCETDADCGAQGKCGDIQFQPAWAMSAITSKACLCNDANKDWHQMCPGTSSSCGKDDKGNPTVCLSGWCDLRFCSPPPMP